MADFVDVQLVGLDRDRCEVIPPEDQRGAPWYRLRFNLSTEPSEPWLNQFRLEWTIPARGPVQGGGTYHEMTVQGRVVSFRAPLDQLPGIVEALRRKIEKSNQAARARAEEESRKKAEWEKYVADRRAELDQAAKALGI